MSSCLGQKEMLCGTCLRLGQQQEQYVSQNRQYTGGAWVAPNCAISSRIQPMGWERAISAVCWGMPLCSL